MADEPLAIPLDEIQVDDKTALSMKKPVQILWSLRSRVLIPSRFRIVTVRNVNLSRRGLRKLRSLVFGTLLLLTGKENVTP
ncbi:hypothetical protein Tco_1083683 [Tanacetum coccineum]